MEQLTGFSTKIEFRSTSISDRNKLFRIAIIIACIQLIAGQTDRFERALEENISCVCGSLFSLQIGLAIKEA